MADRLSELLGMDVEIYPVSGPGATIEALRFGHADLGFLDGGAAWLSWQITTFRSWELNKSKMEGRFTMQ